MTDFQDSGRGQRGNTWLSNPGENLLFSVVLHPENMLAGNQFLLQRMVSVALIESINMKYSIASKIKWPNDIFIGNLKVAGTLIENTLLGNRIETAIIGIGLNVNQEVFDGLKGTSIRNEVGEILDRDEILEAFLLSMERQIYYWENGQEDVITREYIRHLYWLGEKHIFRSGASLITGEITGVSSLGRLQIDTENEIQEFDIKEIVYIE